MFRETSAVQSGGLSLGDGLGEALYPLDADICAGGRVQECLSEWAFVCAVKQS